MATRQGVNQLWSLVVKHRLHRKRNGQPLVQRDEVPALLESWLDLFQEVTDQALLSAFKDWLADPATAKRFPQPHLLLIKVQKQEASRPDLELAGLPDDDSLKLLLEKARSAVEKDGRCPWCYLPAGEGHRYEPGFWCVIPSLERMVTHGA